MNIIIYRPFALYYPDGKLARRFQTRGMANKYNDRLFQGQGSVVLEAYEQLKGEH